MATVTAGQKFMGLASAMDTTEKKSDFLNANTEFHTIEEIRAHLIQTPASASASGVAGTIVADASYIYVCIATDTWERVAIASW